MTLVGICAGDAPPRSVLDRALRDEGCDVRGRGDGRGAVKAISGPPPDLVALDDGLPDADGRDLRRALPADGVAVPVRFLTAGDALTAAPSAGDPSWRCLRG